MILAGVLAGCGALRTPVAASAGSPETVSAAARASVATAGATTVVVDCLNKAQLRPASFVLTCADANDVLTGMRWVKWASEAFATGTEKINSCVPNCAEGTFISYPALVALWRPEPLPHHPGVRYFSRITRIYTGRRPPLYACHGVGKPPCHPVTATMGLWGQLTG